MAEQAPGDFNRQFGSGLPQEDLVEQKPASGGATLVFERLFAGAPAGEPERVGGKLSAASGAGGFTQLFEPTAAPADAVAAAPKIEARIEMDPAEFIASDVTLDIPRSAAEAAAPAGFTGLFAPEVVSAPSNPAVKTPVPMIEFSEPQLPGTPSLEQAATSAGSFTALFNTPPKTAQPIQSSSSFNDAFAAPVESEATAVAPAQPGKSVLSP